MGWDDGMGGDGIEESRIKNNTKWHIKMLRIVCEIFTSVIFLFFNVCVCTELSCRMKSVSAGHSKKMLDSYCFLKYIFMPWSCYSFLPSLEFCS